jgi:hypothetical protein
LVYDELFSLAYYGNGGWTWEIAYNLPVHIRRYCLKLLKDAKEKENEEIEKNKTSAKSSHSGPPRIPSAVNTALANKKTIPRRPPKK